MVAGAALSAPAKAPTKASVYPGQLAKAKADGKILLVDFFTDWCYWCGQLDKQVYPDTRVSELIDKYFVLVKINAEEDVATATKFKVTAYPTIVALDGDGKVLKRIEGFEEPKLFAADLEEAVELQKLRAEAQGLKVDLATGKAEDAGDKEARLGYILLRLGDTKGAAQWLTKAKADGVDTPDLTLNTMLTTKTGGDLVKALDDWTVANPESPRKWEAEYALGMAQSKARQWKDALASMNQVVAGAPDSVFGLRAATQVKPLEQRIADDSRPATEPSTGHG
jgi:thiol:disulfide interchange protein DsbD